MPADVVRTFLAVMVGDETRRQLERLADELSRDLVGFKWAKGDQPHLTLAFLGDIEAARIGDLTAAATEAVRGFCPFTVRWQGLGAFPKPFRAHILWVGVGQGEQALVELQGAVAVAIAAAGLQA